jgi:hypothetical protein
MADVQISVGLRRKACEDLAFVLPAGVVFFDDLPDEMVGFSGFFVGHACFAWEKFLKGGILLQAADESKVGAGMR